MLLILDTTVIDLVGLVEFSIYGSAATTHHALPGMRDFSRGTILLANSGSATTPNLTFPQ